jgi:hypothetical protein
MLSTMLECDYADFVSDTFIARMSRYNELPG